MNSNASTFCLNMNLFFRILFGLIYISKRYLTIRLCASCVSVCVARAHVCWTRVDWVDPLNILMLIFPAYHEENVGKARSAC